MKRIIFIISSTILLINCGLKKQDGEPSILKELRLWSINTSIQLPDYKIVDTVKYGNEVILNYKIKSVDSSLDMIVFVKSYEKARHEQFDIEHAMAIQKGEVERGQNKKRLITEKYKNIDSIKIGYCKYLVEQQNRTFFSSRIFFYRDRKYVELWLFEEYQNAKGKKCCLTDRVLESIKLY